MSMTKYIIVEAARDEHGVLRLVPDPGRQGAHVGARRAPLSSGDMKSARLGHFAELFEPLVQAIEDHPHLRREIAVGCLLLRGETRAASAEEALRLIVAPADLRTPTSPSSDPSTSTSSTE